MVNEDSPLKILLDALALHNLSWEEAEVIAECLPEEDEQLAMAHWLAEATHRPSRQEMLHQVVEIIKSKAV